MIARSTGVPSALGTLAFPKFLKHLIESAQTMRSIHLFHKARWIAGPLALALVAVAGFVKDAHAIQLHAEHYDIINRCWQCYGEGKWCDY